MSDPEFGIEVPEADRLEQLQDAALDAGPAEHPEDPHVIDTGEANPADVLEQQLEVRQDEEDW